MGIDQTEVPQQENQENQEAVAQDNAGTGDQQPAVTQEPVAVQQEEAKVAEVGEAN